MDHKELFTSINRLDQNVIIYYILEFLSRHELHMLASLFYRPHSKEILNKFYNQTLLNTIQFGKCLMIYSWSDWFWKDLINNKIELINSVIIKKIGWNKKLGNYRLRFIKEIWKRIDVKNWKQIQQRRNERFSYIRSIGSKIGEIAQLNEIFKNVECESIIRKRIAEQIFIKESIIQEPLQETLKLNPEMCMKWVPMGANGVGKTCLMTRVGYHYFPEDFIPTVFDSYSRTEFVKCLVDGVETQVEIHIGYWDSFGGQDYDRLRSLNYPDTSVFTLSYAINDFSSLKYLVEHLLWECIICVPTATFVVASTKNDLKDSLYWNSLFSSSVEEPISKEEGIEFTKAIGADSFIETSAKSGQGTFNFDKRLALLIHTRLSILENPHLAINYIDKTPTQIHTNHPIIIINHTLETHESKKEQKTCTFQ